MLVDLTSTPMLTDNSTHMNYERDLFIRLFGADNISVYELAKLTGLDESNLSKTLRGKRSISLQAVVSFCQLAGVDPRPEIIRWAEHQIPDLRLIEREQPSEHPPESAHWIAFRQ